MAVKGSASAAVIATAQASLRAGRLREARERYAQAATTADVVGDAPALISAALGIGGLWVYEQRGVLERSTLADLWSRATRLAAPNSVESNRLEVRIAAEAVYEGGPIEAVQEAVDRVLSQGDSRATAEALSLLHHVQLGPQFAASRPALADSIIEHGTRAGDRVLSLMGLMWRTVDLYLLGNVRADQSLQDLTEEAFVAGCEAVMFIARVLGAMRLGRAGRFEEAEAEASDAWVLGEEVGDPDAPAYFGAMLAALRWWQGRGDEILGEVRSLAQSPRLAINDHVYMAADAAMSANLGDIEGAEGALFRLSSIGLANLPPTSSWLATQLIASEAAYLIGDSEVAYEVGRLIAPYARLPVMPSLAVVCLGSAERALGLAAATLGDFDAAVAHLHAAIGTDQRLGNRPMATLTQHTMSQILSARDGEGDRSRAQRLSERVAASSAEMGMILPNAPSWLAPPKPLSHQVLIQRHQTGWRLKVDGRTTAVADQVGMRYLAALLAAPEADQHVLRLLVGPDQPQPMARASQQILDRHARRSLQERAGVLIEKRSASSDEELRAVREALHSATGLFGRSRDFPTEQERARTSVRKALMRALDLVERTEAPFAEHLRRQITTGYFCRYDPAPGWAIRLKI